MTVENKTEFPETPQTLQECLQASYVMSMWVLQKEMGVSYTDSRLLLWGNRPDDFNRIATELGITEDDSDYENRLSELGKLAEDLNARHVRELRARCSRFFNCFRHESDMAYQAEDFGEFR